MALGGFIILATVCIGCALAVVMQRNALFGALNLVGVFAATAALYLMLSAPFLAMVQVMVYAGAIMVLFIFVIMLLGVNYDESGEASGIPSGAKRLLAASLSGLLAALIILLSVTAVFTEKPGEPGSDMGSVTALGMTLYKKYVFPFEVASILLLVAIVGAVAITRRHGRGLEGHVGSEEGS